MTSLNRNLFLLALAALSFFGYQQAQTVATQPAQPSTKRAPITTPTASASFIWAARSRM
jgi:hypothetical protein